MPRSVTAYFATRAEADAAASRLQSAGIDGEQVKIEDGQKGGFFDELVGFLQPASSGTASRPRFRLSADIDAEQAELAQSILGAGGVEASAGDLSDRMFEFRETAETLDVATEAVVREEIVLRKVALEREEIIHDTVRKTEVEVEEIKPEPRSGTPRRP